MKNLFALVILLSIISVQGTPQSDRVAQFKREAAEIISEEEQINTVANHAIYGGRLHWSVIHYGSANERMICEASSKLIGFIQSLGLDDAAHARLVALGQGLREDICRLIPPPRWAMPER